MQLHPLINILDYNMVIKFYMTGGHVIVIDGVANVTMHRDNTTGKYTGYNISYLNTYDRHDRFISLSIPDIIAVVEE